MNGQLFAFIEFSPWVRPAFHEGWAFFLLSGAILVLKTSCKVAGSLIRLPLSVALVIAVVSLRDGSRTV
jgi:hypothetical protein